MVEAKVLVNLFTTKTIARIFLESDKAVERGAYTYWRECREILSVSAGGAGKKALAWRRSRNNVRSKVVRKEIKKAIGKGMKLGAARKHASGVYEKYRHSKPGEPPRMITGFLRSNVVVRKVKSNQYRVGLFKNAVYGWYLDQGTDKIAPRPWILPALRKALPRITAEVVRLGVR